MKIKNWIFKKLFLAIFMLAAANLAAADGKLLKGVKTKRELKENQNEIIHRCLTPSASEIIKLPVMRKSPWSLPDKSLAAGFEKTVNILVLRFNFQYETVDDSTTTGRGNMNLSTDSAAFWDEFEHYIDPPPHDSLYFDAHMRALNSYYEHVTEGGLHLNWDIFPGGKNSAYQLPHPMSYYGACVDDVVGFDSIIAGLERYFVDCIRLVDSTSPDVVFSNYESVFLIHPGSDQQNNIGFPNTCRDMFTGFIKFGDSIVADDGTVFASGIPVDDSADTIKTALLLPETVSQDNRATALNAVLAHEFGHQLGLVDLYRTGNFRTQLGDFALMDNNGFGTGVDFGFPVGSVFGINPLYPCAWSRAYLGFEEVVDFRRGDDIRLVAAEVISDGIQIARIPISEDEYYLIENRVIEADGRDTYIFADAETNVIQGPSDADKNLTGEYDHLMPGSGVIIYHVDESVARADFNRNGINNFYDNQLQLDPYKRFIRIVEADGIVDFGGYYNSGFGRETDMFREDRNNSFTPNTNPASFDNTGNNTHVRITDIRRDTTIIGINLQPIDTVVKFDVEIDGLVDNFPIRCGYRYLAGILKDSLDNPVVARFNTLSTIADDLDKDGFDEIITASNENVLAFTTDGKNFMREFTGCSSCQAYYDDAISRFDGDHFTTGEDHFRENSFEIPLYFQVNGFITAGPVTGDFGETDSLKLVAAGRLQDLETGVVVINALRDDNNDTQADNFMAFATVGWPVEMSFGNHLYVVTDRGYFYFKDAYDADDVLEFSLDVDSVHGACRNGDDFIVLAEDKGISIILYYDYSLSAFYDPLDISEKFIYGPVLADINRDAYADIVITGHDGDILIVTVDSTQFSSGNIEQIMKIIGSEASGYTFKSDPIIADVDGNGFADIVIGGEGYLYAFDRNLMLLADYPVQIDDRLPDDFVFSAPVAANLNNDNKIEIVIPTYNGNVYSFSPDLSYGFPLSGGERSNGSPLVVKTASGAALGFMGDDGWFYLWDLWAGEYDEQKAYWPMTKADPYGTNNFDMSKLSTPSYGTDLLPDAEYYNYPNPVTNGSTKIRYTLNDNANVVTLIIYDLTGQEITKLDGTIITGVNEVEWTCHDVSPGVYRCVITADFNGQSKNAFTDIAVIR